MPALETLKKRPEFLAVRGGLRASCAACLIEGKPPTGAPVGDMASPPRFGFTVTKKLGNAVTRNRIRRRLKAAILAAASRHAKPGFDYVVVARGAAFDHPFAALVADLERTLETLHRDRKTDRRQSGKRADEAPRKKAGP